MAEVINMPRLSDTMEEGTLAKWFKKVGDSVNEGDILAEIETDKATMEFESFHEGELLYIGIKEGETAPVDSIIAIIGKKGENISSLINVSESKSKKEPDPVKEPERVKEPEPVKVPETLNTPNLQKEETKSTNTLKDSGNKVLISPLANKLAIERGVDLSQVKGTGDNGRIVKRDIENYKPATFVNTNNMIIATEESSYDLPNSTMRKSIAKRLSESKFTAPHYYLTVEFEMDNMISFREQYINTQNIKISYNDIIAKAVALSLVKNPKVNSRWHDNKIEISEHVHLGVAVAVEDGLVVPVIQFASSKDMSQINTEVKDFAERAKNKKLTPAEIQGSTFTISNLGMFGIESFTSIINQPNSAILSIGSIIEKPIVRDGEVVVGNTMKLTLACDHRAVDGATGSSFLKTLKEYIENPVSILI